MHPHTCDVRGIAIFEKKQLAICRPCQLDKQLKVSHKVLQQRTIMRAPELLHMELMRLIKVESTGGKSYVSVYDDIVFNSIALSIAGVEFIGAKSY